MINVIPKNEPSNGLKFNRHQSKRFIFNCQQSKGFPPPPPPPLRPSYWFIVRRETGHAFYVIGFKNIRIHPSTRYRTRFGFIFFHSGGRIYFFPDSLTVAVSGKKKLRIRKYPDTCTCGRGQRKRKIQLYVKIAKTEDHP